MEADLLRIGRQGGQNLYLSLVWTFSLMSLLHHANGLILEVGPILLYVEAVQGS